MSENEKNYFNNPVVVILLVALVGLSGYFLLGKNSGDINSQDLNTTKTIAVAYTDTTANVRECGSLTCKVIGTYDLNTSVDVSSYLTEDVSQLPEWVSFSYLAPDGLSTTGYISKSVLSNSQVSTESTPSVVQNQKLNSQNSTKSNFDNIEFQNNIQTQTQQTYSAETLATQLGPQLAYITCYWYNQYGNILSFKTSNGLLGPKASNGSYFISTVLGGVMDTTYPRSSLAPGSCSIQFPAGVSLYAGGASSLDVESTYSTSPVSVGNTNIDFAQIIVNMPNRYLENYARKLNYCSERGSVGDLIAVIGWPTDSPSKTISGSITGTSGYYDLTNIFVPDGMQGSTVVSLTYGCVLGQINSSGQIADMQGLAYVLGF